MKFTLVAVAFINFSFYLLHGLLCHAVCNVHCTFCSLSHSFSQSFNKCFFTQTSKALKQFFSFVYSEVVVAMQIKGKLMNWNSDCQQYNIPNTQLIQLIWHKCYPKMNSIYAHRCKPFRSNFVSNEIIERGRERQSDWVEKKLCKNKNELSVV